MNTVQTVFHPHVGAPTVPALQRRSIAPLTFAAQVVFVLLFFVGDAKGNPWFAWIPFDLTVATGCVVLTFGLLSLLITNGKISKQVMWMIAFFFVMSFAAWWTQWTPYGLDKAERFFTLAFMAAVLPEMLFTDLAAVKRFVACIIVFGTVISLGALFQLAGGSRLGERVTGFITMTISLGRFAGMALLGLYATMFRSGGKKLWLLLLCLPLFLVVVASGARGPLIFLVGVIALLTARFSLSNRYSLVLALVLILATGLLLSRYAESLPQASINRIEGLLQRQYDDSANERVTAGSAAAESIGRNPFGLGFGGFGRAYSFGMGTDRSYPHNLVLEIAAENGWLAAALFVCIAGFALLRSYRAAVLEPEFRPFLAIFVFLLANTLVSGDINDNRLVFALLGIGLQAQTLCTKTPDMQYQSGL